MWTRTEYRERPSHPPAPALPTHSTNLTGRVSEAPSAEEQRFVGPPLPYVC